MAYTMQMQVLSEVNQYVRQLGNGALTRLVYWVISNWHDDCDHVMYVTYILVINMTSNVIKQDSLFHYPGSSKL